MLLGSFAIGTPGEWNTIARDVYARGDTNVLTGSSDTIFVVGSTNEATNGGTDGFVDLVLRDAFQQIYSVFHAVHGGPGDDGLTGVNGWNEHPDHIAVTGFRGNAGGTDIDVASFYLYGGGYSPPISASMRLIRDGQMIGSGFEAPTAMGAMTITTPRPQVTVIPFETFGLGGPAGGGVAQERNGRIHVVGATTSLDYPHPQGRVRSTALIPSGAAGVPDAVHSVIDLLPAGVGRTDGTGAIVTAFPYPYPVFPRPGTDGGTTPPCALVPFGTQIGLAPPLMQRALIDYEGPQPAGGLQGVIVVDRPPPTSSLIVGALRVGFPGDPVNLLPIVLYGVELWTYPDPDITTVFLPTADRTFRSDEISLPNGPLTFSAQVVFLLGAAPCSSGTTTLAATPALWVSY